MTHLNVSAITRVGCLAVTLCSMNMKRRHILMTAMVGCLLCCSVTQAKGPPKQAAYTIVPFMSPDVATVRSGVDDLNEAGIAVGGWELSNGDHQAVYYDGEDYQTLLSFADAGALGVNNLNQIVGQDGDAGAFWSTSTAVPVPLPSLDPTDPQSEVRSWATGINDDGFVIGASQERFLDSNGQILEDILTAVMWRVVVDNVGVHVDGPHPLLPLNGHLESFAGTGCLTELAGGFVQVTGYSSYSVDIPALPSAAVVWTIGLNPDGTLVLPGPPVNVGAPGASEGLGINNFGEVCGRADKRPFVVLAGQAPQLLPVTRKTADGYALKINDAGEIVGFLGIYPKGSNIFANDWQAYLWRDGEKIELQRQIVRNSGWAQLRWATSINNAGIIAGWGKFDVDHRGFLLIPNTP
jgi:hypothetical protein